MSVKEQLKTTKTKVEFYLKEHKFKEVYKDDDEKLVARFWADQLRESGLEPDKITAAKFLATYASNNILTCAETIVRARRILQKKDESLRGKSYKERHEEEVDVRQAIGHDQI